MYRRYSCVMNACVCKTISRGHSQLLLTSWLLLGVVTLLNQGCSHFMEARTIQQFANALQEADYEQLLASTSEEFEGKALRAEAAVEDFKLLKFPKGKTSIDNVEDVSDTEKEVTVSIAGSKRKLRYTLTKNEESGKWEVDDVLIRQNKDGVKVTKSVTEQMNLLLSVREFLTAWSGKDRERILATLSPEFEQQLQPLHDPYLFYLTHRAVGERSEKSKFKPEAQLDDGVAVVKLPRSRGVMVISCRLVDNNWKIDDLAVESKGDSDHINSVRKLANVVTASTQFLTAWHTADHKLLKQVSTRKFYEGSLAPADLKLVVMPGVETPSDNLKIKILKHRADFILEEQGSLFSVSLKQAEQQSARSADKYLVDDITIFDLNNGEEKRLSALFTTHAVIKIFADATEQQNLDMLKKSSTADFNRRVWNKLSDEALPLFPMYELGQGMPKIISTEFQGAVTKVSVQRGANNYLYVMRNRSGELRVDDVQLELQNRPNSFKTTLELLMPVVQFSAAIHAGRVDLVQRTVSEDYNRLIWRQVRGMPTMAQTVPTYLSLPVTAIESGDETHLIVLGDEQTGARVTVQSEHGLLVVDEVEIIAGTEPEQHAKLKQTMRSKMAAGELDISKKSNAAKTGDYSAPAEKQSGAPAPASRLQGQTSGRESLSEADLLKELYQQSHRDQPGRSTRKPGLQQADYQRQTTLKQPRRRFQRGRPDRMNDQQASPPFVDPADPARPPGVGPGDIIITPDHSKKQPRQYDSFPPLTQ